MKLIFNNIKTLVITVLLTGFLTACGGGGGGDGGNAGEDDDPVAVMKNKAILHIVT